MKNVRFSVIMARAKPVVSAAYTYGSRHPYQVLILATAAAGLIGYGGYAWYTNVQASVTHYIPTQVKTAHIESSVSGTGQVAASNEVGLKVAASSDVVYVGAQPGDYVKKGQIIVQLNSADAQKAVRDARLNLTSAQLSLEKLTNPPTALELLQAKNALTSAQESKQSDTDSLNKSYEDGFNAVSDTFLDLPTVMSGLQSLLYNSTISASQDNIDAYRNMLPLDDSRVIVLKHDVAAAYENARTSYDQAFILYGTVSRTSSPEDIARLIETTYSTTRSVSEAVKKTTDFLNYVNDYQTTVQKGMPSQYQSHKATLASNTGVLSSHLSNLLSAKSSITSYASRLLSDQRSIDEKTQSLADLTAGADTLDLKSQQLSVAQRQNALLDAQETLAKYTIRAPFDGVVATLSVKKGHIDVSGTVGSIITDKYLAQVTLNEVDVAKVAAGQKVSLVLDAFDEAEPLEGVVVSIDQVGTVSQGVVSYAVTVSFDPGELSVKPGMNASAIIVVESKDDALVIPTSALKSDRRGEYVEVLDGMTLPDEGAEISSSTRAVLRSIMSEGVVPGQAPRIVYVTTGISNDTMVEITSGLSGGEVIVIGTVSAASTQTNSSTQSSLFQFGPQRPSGTSNGTRTQSSDR